MVGQKTFDTIIEWYRFGSWVLKKHPEIYLEYFIRPFEHLCPKCKSELVNVNTEPQYWMCFSCIKGYTNEELKGDKKQCPITTRK